ncbi:membrane protein [Thalassobaculum fulvum]|uniref:Membrane protein n=1 Tax=Thalassobaculum fulvum TaxID=1633335 RepID=A0A918XW67_9PROT|nr:GDYXXLXY domain-containing protein [Thalassobaculum fulvum]GHD59180.1 membrane protein [Thalassobaculum fulvum]
MARFLPAIGLWGGLALVLVAVNLLIVEKQRVLDDGRTVLLALRPVDPRSLIQGDYMELRYHEALVPADAAADTASPETDGRVVVALDADGVATFRRFDDGGPLAADEQRLRYKRRAPSGLQPDPENSELFIGAESFLFQEGHAEAYEEARYGILKVAPDGSSVLAGLADSGRRPIRP